MTPVIVIIIIGFVFVLAYIASERISAAYRAWCKTHDLDPRDLANARRWLRAMFGRDEDGLRGG